jgi:hypothetical protein
MLHTQMDMRIPAEEREQTDANNKLKEILQRLVDSATQITCASDTALYESFLDKCLHYQPPTIEEKVITEDIKALLPDPETLKQMMIAQAQQQYGSTTQ